MWPASKALDCVYISGFILLQMRYPGDGGTQVKTQKWFYVLVWFVSRQGLVSQALYVTEDEPECLIFLPPPLKSWHHHTGIIWCWVTEPMALCMLSRHSMDWGPISCLRHLFCLICLVLGTEPKASHVRQVPYHCIPSKFPLHPSWLHLSRELREEFSTWGVTSCSEVCVQEHSRFEMGVQPMLAGDPLPAVALGVRYSPLVTWGTAKLLQTGFSLISNAPASCLPF